jgi:F-type H+-transporting ATPase subunit b
MFDEKFWLAISFVTFAVLFKKYAWPHIIKGLDSKSKEIANSILEAKEMKEGAERLLIEAKKYHQEARDYANKILQDAEKDAKNLTSEAKDALEKEIAKISTAAKQRIKNEEEKAVRQIKEEIVAKAMKNIEADFNNIDRSSHSSLIDSAATRL